MTDSVLALTASKPNWEEHMVAALVERLSDIQKRVINGCSESLQLNALVSAFILARQMYFE